MEQQKLSRADWFLELLTQWEMLLAHTETPPSTKGKRVMKLQLEHAINWLKRTYDVDVLMDVSEIERIVDGDESKAEDVSGNGIGEGDSQCASASGESGASVGESESTQE